jgi:hypothetical protein
MIGHFHSDWLGCRPGSVSYWPTAGRGRDRKIRQPSRHYRGELRVDLAGIFNSAQAELSHDTPHLLVVQLQHSSADPGQITSNVYVSHIRI